LCQREHLIALKTTTTIVEIALEAPPTKKEEVSYFSLEQNSGLHTLPNLRNLEVNYAIMGLLFVELMNFKFFVINCSEILQNENPYY